MRITSAAWSGCSNAAIIRASPRTTPRSSHTRRTSHAAPASYRSASNSRCCTACGATCSRGCGGRATTCVTTLRSAASGIRTSCVGSPSGRRTSPSCSATSSGSRYGGAERRHAGRLPAGARAGAGVQRQGRSGVLGRQVRGRCAGCDRTLRRGPPLRALVRGGRSSGGARRDRVPRLGEDARRGVGTGARADAPGREATSRPLHRRDRRSRRGRGRAMALTTGVVLARVGSTYRVHADRGEVTAVLRGRLKRRDDDRVVAGDVVELELQPDGPATISAVRPRRSVLARRAAGERSPRAQPLAANVDQVVVVAAARDPEPNLRMLDRFLVVAEGNGIPPVIVLNKIELERSAEQAFQRRFGPAGYQVLGTSVKQPEGLAALRDLLRGRESVLAGQSGVGKSSLLNALDPGLNLRIGEISAKWDTGKHTTRAALVVPVATGGYVVDTPGLREVGTWGIDPERLGAYFVEFRPFLDQCRFDNCRHLAEPGCGVRQAAERGAFDPDRLGSYQRIYEEVSVPSWSSDRRRGR